MTSNPYLKPLVRWWRLIVTVTILAVVVSGISTLLQPDTYVSRTTLVVGTTFLDPNPNTNQLIIGQQLAQIYADMALREPIQTATMHALKMNWLPQYQARVVPNTQIIEISVTDTNPQRAQVVASELANQLILQSPTISDTQTGEQQDFINQQLSSLRNQIDESQKNLAELQKNLVGLTSASQIANIQRQIDDQSQKLNSLRTSYANFLANSQKGAVNILTPVEPANLPTHPVGTTKAIIIVLAGLVGLSLGMGAAYLLEQLDTTVKTASDVEHIFHLPVIGYISETPKNGSTATYVAKNPNSILAENFRMLQSNIEFCRLSSSIKTVLITSPSQGNGKSTVASNLALAISQDGQDVILVDADLRRPSVHRSLKMTMDPGLSDILDKKADLQSATREWSNEESEENEGCLRVITAGSKPSSVTEVIRSKRIASVLSELRDKHELVIIDAPPLIIADSYNLASRADGVIIVMEPGQTAHEQAKAIKEQLSRAEAKILGIVFNKVSEDYARSYGDYQYRSLYLPQHYSDDSSMENRESAATPRSKKLMDFFEHGKFPPEVARNVENVIAMIKARRIRKSKETGSP